MAKRLQRQWAARPDLRSSIVGHMKFLFLPEVFNRSAWSLECTCCPLQLHTALPWSPRGPF